MTLCQNAEARVRTVDLARVVSPPKELRVLQRFRRANVVHYRLYTVEAVLGFCVGIINQVQLRASERAEVRWEGHQNNRKMVMRTTVCYLAYLTQG